MTEKGNPLESISIIIPVYNQFQLTRLCLTSILEHSRHPLELWVVDNGSQDETLTRLGEFKDLFQAQGHRFEVLRNAQNLGFGRGCNVGIRKASHNWIVILNNDTWLMPGWDEALIRASMQHQLDCVGPYFFESPDTKQTQELALLKRAKIFTARNQNKIRSHFVPILMCFKRSALNQLQFDHGGIFDERFFVTFEDTDLLHRMHGLNLKYGQSGACFIWHASQGTRSKSERAKQFELDGLTLFIEKWGFDPRPLDHTLIKKLRRSLWRWLEKRGGF